MTWYSSSVESSGAKRERSERVRCLFNIIRKCLLLDENEDKDDALSAMEESSLSESEDDEIISSIRPSKKVIYSSESDMDKPSDGYYVYLLIAVHLLAQCFNVG